MRNGLEAKVRLGFVGQWSTNSEPGSPCQDPVPKAISTRSRARDKRRTRNAEYFSIRRNERTRREEEVCHDHGFESWNYSTVANAIIILKRSSQLQYGKYQIV